MFNLNLRWLDLNHGPLVSEATALPTAPQPLHQIRVVTKLILLYEITNSVVTDNLSFIAKILKRDFDYLIPTKCVGIMVKPIYNDSQRVGFSNFDFFAVTIPSVKWMNWH